jgi:transposase InsO family protein
VRCLSIFKDLCALIKNKHENSVKIIHIDNGTKYVNREFELFLTYNGIEHQTTCVNTPEQNGVNEHKNKHFLEVAHCIQ